MLNTHHCQCGGAMSGTPVLPFSFFSSTLISLLLLHSALPLLYSALLHFVPLLLPV